MYLKKKPVPWKVVQATGGVIFIERKQAKHTCYFDIDAAKEIAAALNGYENEVTRLQNQLDEIIQRGG